MDGNGRQDREGAIRTRRWRDWAGAPGLEAEWDALLERADGASVYQSCAWHRSWWDAFGAEHELLLVTAHAGPRLVGVAPMMVSPAGGRRVRFIGSSNHASDYCDLIVDRDCRGAAQALLDGVRAAAGRWRRIELTHCRGDSPNAPAIAAGLAAGGDRFRSRIEQVAPARRLGDAAADRRAADKNSLRRHARYFRQRGELRLRPARDEREALDWLDPFFAQHVARWAATPTPSLFRDGRQRSFYRALVRRLLPRGWLRFDMLEFDGRPLAFHFGFEYRRRFLWYKPAFDVRLAARSPGEVLIKCLLEDAIERGLEEFDFTIGAEPFKFRFANTVRPILRMTAHASLADYWRDAAHGALQWAWRRLRGREPAASLRLTSGAA